MDAFEKAHEFTARWEGGYIEHANDPGGATKYGISLRFLKSQGLDIGDIDGDGDIDADDIKALSPEDAARIMRREFWDALGLDNLGKPLCARVIYDTAVNMGPSYARRMLQKALGVPADGKWGPITRSAIRICNDKHTAVSMCHIRRARYHELVQKTAALSAFLKGWLRRVDSLETEIERAR